MSVYPDAQLYDPKILRTLFLQFDSGDWEQEMADFHGTDVDIPATLTVDGKEYPNVGVRYRGNSSYNGIEAGHKRSLNISIDLADPKQRLYGYRTLNLLNSHEDPSFLSAVLVLHIAQQHRIPAPKANLVKLVINGESWGIYPNIQQFNKDLLTEHYPGEGKGARWKVPGHPGARGGLEYWGDNPAVYQKHFVLKAGKGEKAWPALIKLCRVLNETPTEELKAKLSPLLDIEETLRFLALDVLSSNTDGYWTRGSDYSLYLDPKGKFHILPYDVNETLHDRSGPDCNRPRRPQGVTTSQGAAASAARPQMPFLPPPPGGLGGPGRFGGPGMGRGGVTLDPLVGLDDETKPLRSRLLAVPELRDRYLQLVREMAEQSLGWDHLGALVEQYVALIDGEIAADTHKLSSYDDFRAAVAGDVPSELKDGCQTLGLRGFAEKRRQYLLGQPTGAVASIGGK